MCRDPLKPGGVMSLRIPLYDSNEETIKSILKYYRFPEDMFTGSSKRLEEIKAALQTVNSMQ